VECVCARCVCVCAAWMWSLERSQRLTFCVWHTCVARRGHQKKRGAPSPFPVASGAPDLGPVSSRVAHRRWFIDDSLLDLTPCAICVGSSRRRSPSNDAVGEWPQKALFASRRWRSSRYRRRRASKQTSSLDGALAQKHLSVAADMCC
jgi:hypothetical protein